MGGNLQQIEALFQAAADLPRDERQAFLARECADDDEVRDRVAAMLERHDRDRTLPSPVESLGETTPLTEGPGSVIDRYRLLERIGEGGFGVVYMAEQQEPVQRKVALKIIKLGMDTREVVARFEAERQALAMMDHPNIARVLDGGATATGRPYFVMELVRGVSITDYCDQDNLAMRERLELFTQVCHAVQHAHQKGVIHRDLKPSNVMVTLHDGRPVPKVIDFGVVKAMHTRLTEKTLFTAYDRFIGTPAYMSPEQAEMSGLDIDTRSDIYSLGVLLYELLTGSTPFESETLLRGGLAEIQRVLREEQPPRPSLRIHSSGNARIASRRRLDLDELSRRVQGELDWIVMKALEKERTRRYETASELAADVRRHLDGEPVLAGEPSRAYRLRKMLSRHRAAVGSASLVVLALVAGIAGTLSGMFEASRQRDAAQQEAANAREVTDFLVETLALTDPLVALDPELSVRTLLDRAAANLVGGFPGQPGAEARVRSTIGRAYENLGQLELAESHLRRAIELFDASDGEPLLDYYTTLWRATHVLFKLEREDAFGMANHARRVGHELIARSRPGLAESLGRFLDEVGEALHAPEGDALDRSLALGEDAARKAEAVLPHGDPLWPVVADTFMDAGYTLWYSALEPANEPFFARALEIQRRELPPNHPDITESVSQLVGVLNRAGRTEDAEARIRESLERLRHVYQPDSFQFAFAESMLGEVLTMQGRYDEAEPVLLHSHEVILSQIEDERTFYVIDSYNRLARLYDGWEREERARPYRQALARIGGELRYQMPWSIARQAFGREHRALIEKLTALEGICGMAAYASLPGTLDSDEANLLAVQVARGSTAFPRDEPLAVILAQLMLSWSNAFATGPGKEALVRHALPVLKQRPTRSAFEIAQALAQLADIALARGDASEARELALEARRWLPETLRRDWITSNAQTRLARCFLNQRLFDSAESLLLSSYETLGSQLGPGSPDTRETRALLARLYTEWGKPQRAAEFGDASES